MAHTSELAPKHDSQDRIYFQPADLCATPQHHQRVQIKESQPVTPHGRVDDGASASAKACDAEIGQDGVSDYKTKPDYLDYFADMECTLRGQLIQIQRFSSYKLAIENLTKDSPNACVLLAASALEESFSGLKHILNGNISLIEHVKKMKGISQEYKEGQSEEVLDIYDGVRDIEQDNSIEAGGQSTFVGSASGASDRRRNDQWNISTPGDDPFVDKTFATTVETPHSLELDYHPDFTGMPGQMLYAPINKEDNGTQLQSRRVILSNLPPDATAAQVIKGVRCYGGVMGITMLNMKPFCGNQTMSALLEFVYPQSAANYANAVHSQELFYENKRGAKFQAAAWLIPSPSYKYSSLELRLLERGQTRAILVQNFPEAAVWYFVCAVGVKNVVDVRRAKSDNGFIFEFATIKEAARVAGLIWAGKLVDIYGKKKRGPSPYTNINDSSQTPYQDYVFQGGNIEHIALDFLEMEWNREPFNAYWSSEEKPVMRQPGLTPEKPTKPARLTTVERLAKQYDIDVDEVADYLEERENYKDTDFRIIGSNITLTRRKWGWSISKEDEAKLLMAMTLHEPGWAEEWDSHFESRGEVNLRTWEQYGMLARERREKAEQQGLEEGKVPAEGDGIKSAPVPAMIKNYLDVSKVTYAGKYMGCD